MLHQVVVQTIPGILVFGFLDQGKQNSPSFRPERFNMVMRRGGGTFSGITAEINVFVASRETNKQMNDKHKQNQ